MQYVFERRIFPRFGWWDGNESVSLQNTITFEERVMNPKLDVPDEPNERLDVEYQDELIAEHRHLLQEYVSTVLDNASWYNKQVFWELAKQHAFLVISILLLFAIPVLIVLLPTAAGSIGSSASGEGMQAAIWSSLVLGVISSLISLQRVFGAWFGRRKVVSQRWRARAALMDIAYKLESDWRYRDKFRSPSSPKQRQAGQELNTQFVRQLKSSIRKARKIIHDETQVFFDNYSLPDIDVGTSLVNSGNITKGLMKIFRAPIDKQHTHNEERLALRLKAEAEYLKTEAKVTYLQANFDHLNREVELIETNGSSGLNAQEQELHARKAVKLEKIKNDIATAERAKLAAQIEKHQAYSQ